MKKLFAIILSVLLITCIFTGCSAQKNSASYIQESTAFSPENNGGSFNQDNIYADTAPPADGGVYNEGNTKSQITLPQGRKIILNATIEMEAVDYDEAYNLLIDEIGDMGGYVSYSMENGNASKGSIRYLNITARIPTANYSSFLSIANDIGNVLSKRESTDDVTAQYVDVKARLDTLRVKEERLLAILETATDLESIISIENSLSDVRYEIESYEATKRTLDDLIDYSTVEISLREVKSLTETDDSFFAKLGDAFKGMCRNFVYSLERFAIGFVYAIPTLVIIAVIVIAIIVIIKKAKRKAAKKTQASTQTNTDTNTENK